MSLTKGSLQLADYMSIVPKLVSEHLLVYTLLLAYIYVACHRCICMGPAANMPVTCNILVSV